MAAQQERATRTRQALLRSAAEVFDRCGYTQAKLADISAGAGVSPGALHFHFENKLAVADAVESAASRTLQRAAHIAYHERVHALQALTDISHAFAGLLRRDVVTRAGFQLDNDNCRHGHKRFSREWHTCIERLLAQADREKVLARQVEPVAMSCTIMAATTGIGILIKDSDDSRIGLALTGFWQAFLPGLAVPEVLGGLRPAGNRAVVDKAVAVSAQGLQEAQSASWGWPGSF
ncbi:ScbR family autoregulator-binding transcription factor [Streptomyces sp. NPDC002889]|uniref:ScbR family autoregulator-binding transcription factor n=1 Tax=Streptomyces sp. NPDC002889 TaxID=3364669 RepID=UPI00369278FD